MSAHSSPHAGSSSTSAQTPYSFVETSIWLETPNNLQPSLQENTSADVAIIGGGYTGLSTALALKAAGVDVAVLEMDFCGKGASGRNQGHLTPTIGKDLPTLVKYVGKQRAVEYARFADRAVRHTESIFTKYNIDCDYKPVGNIIAGVHPRHRIPLERTADLASSLGIPVQFLPEAEMIRRQLPPAFRFGVLEHCGGHLDPGKYIMGLRNAALAAGVRIYEGTPVTNINEVNGKIILDVPSAQLKADKLVIATNAYTCTTLKQQHSRVLPMRVTLFRTKKLTPQQREALGWPGEEGVYTAHESLESYRISPDGRLIGGSKYVQYGYGSTLPSGNMPEIFQRYQKLLKERFPELPSLEIEHFWGGWIGMSLDFLPFSFGNKRGTQFYGMGYNGHGVAQATFNGEMLADQVLGRPNENVELLKRRVIPLPPEPLRWAVVHGMKAFFELTDKRVDADLRQSKIDW